MLRIRELRREKRLTQRDIAEFLDTSTVTVTRYETGEREPSLDTVVRLADYFGVSVDYLLGRTEIRNMATPEVKRETIEALSDDQRAIVTAFVDALIANKKT